MTPPCYALVIPGLEPVAADEITRDLAGTVKRTGKGMVVFRVEKLDYQVLRLRTTEDVFLLAWGTDDLTYRAADLDRIRQWTARQPDWKQLLRIHHQIRPKPKGKPTYRLVTQMSGEHGYRRKDAGEALARGLAGKLPASWRHADENAAVEIWLTIHGATAVCGLRLSDRSMRHRTYKAYHLPASLRPTLAAAMVRLAGAGPNQVVLDPMCGAGTILAEQIERNRLAKIGPMGLWGGDLDLQAVRAAAANLRRLGVEPGGYWSVGSRQETGGHEQAAVDTLTFATLPLAPHSLPFLLARWDAGRLPLPNQSVDRLISNAPFGRQLGRPEEIAPLYSRILPEYDRVLKPEGRAVLLVSDGEPLRSAARLIGWQSMRQLRVRVLGQPALLTVWKKGSNQ